MDGILKRVADGKVHMLGCDWGGFGVVIAETETAIVVKWPGHSGWYARGSFKYYSPTYVVYKKVGIRDLNQHSGLVTDVEEVIEWTSKRKKNGTKKETTGRD